MAEDDHGVDTDSGFDTDPNREHDADDTDHPFATTIREGVLQVRRAGTRWLSSGWDGGFLGAPAAYNLSVPTGFSRTDLDTYIDERRRKAGFSHPGPALLTGLALRHARGARSESVGVIATAGLSNPAALPMRPDGSDDSTGTDDRRHTGTVNLVVVTARALDDAGLTTLLATAVEAKAATLVATTGFPGTTSDAVVVGCDPAGEYEHFAGSATPVGAAARACVRDAVSASLRSRYSESALPETVEAAQYGIQTTRSTESFDPFEP